jgi:cytochrome c oxidase subunit 3
MFLIFEAMLFGALFAAYALLRSEAPEFDPWAAKAALLDVWPPVVQSVVMILSCATAALAWGAAAGGRPKGQALKFISWTALLGCVFLIFWGGGCWFLFHAGMEPANHNYFGLFYMMTGLHALHVLVGTVLWFYYLATGGAMLDRDPARFAGQVECLGLFWQFLGLLWIAMVFALYLFR